MSDLFPIGATVRSIWISEDQLALMTDQGWVVWGVDGDCCSTSYFFDFYGVENLLTNGPVAAFESIDLSPGDPGYKPSTWEPDANQYEEIEVYGFRLTTRHPLFGPVSSVLSFRNSSNGHYGGWMSRMTVDPSWTPDRLTRVTEDVSEVASWRAP